MSCLDQTEWAQVPEVGFRLETHSQSFLFRHDEHSRGAVSLRTHTNKQFIQLFVSGDSSTSKSFKNKKQENQNR